MSEHVFQARHTRANDTTHPAARRRAAAGSGRGRDGRSTTRRGGGLSRAATETCVCCGNACSGGRCGTTKTWPCGAASSVNCRDVTVGAAPSSAESFVYSLMAAAYTSMNCHDVTVGATPSSA